MIAVLHHDHKLVALFRLWQGYQFVNSNVLQWSFGERHLQLLLKLAVRSILYTGAAVTKSSVDVAGHVEPVQAASHGVVHSKFGRVTSQKGLVAKINEMGAR